MGGIARRAIEIGGNCIALSMIGGHHYKHQLATNRRSWEGFFNKGCGINNVCIEVTMEVRIEFGSGGVIFTASTL